jgi:predicted Zn-dependent protease
MIPTIEQIIYDLLAGKLNEPEAIKLIDRHIRLALQASEDKELRDVFAMAAMQGILAGPCSREGVPISGWFDAPTFAYQVADSMLEARKK